MASATIYEEIDPEIRELVRWLRDRGFNTTCSCQGGEGHSYARPTIEVDLIELGEGERLAMAVAERQRGEFTVEAILHCATEGLWVRRAIVTLGSVIPPKRCVAPQWT